MKKVYSLLWLNGAGANEEILCTKASSPEEAAERFNMPVNGYLKCENGGAWCVAENL